MTTEPVNSLANGVTAELYKAIIGPRGEDYYLRHFLKFDAAGRSRISWHWPACGATLSWLVFRKMWSLALVYGVAMLGSALLIFGVGRLVFDYSGAISLLLSLLFLTVACVVPGLYANAWYYAFCSRRISAALQDSANVKEACEMLAGQASTKRRWLGLAAVNGVVLALLAGVTALVMNFGQEGAHLVQPKQAEPVAGDLAVAVLTGVVSGRVAGMAQPPSPPLVAPTVVPIVSAAASAAAVPASGSSPAHGEATLVKGADKTSETPPAKVPATVDAQAALPVAPPKAMRPAPVSRGAGTGQQTASGPVAPASAGQQSRAPEPAKPVAAVGDPGPRAKPVRVDPPVKPKVAKTGRLWFVQVGAFGREANAQNVRAKLEATGLSATADASDTPAGRLIRVRVGPFDSKGEAERAALQVKALDLPAVLVRP